MREADLNKTMLYLREADLNKTMLEQFLGFLQEPKSGLRPLHDILKKGGGMMQSDSYRVRQPV